MTSTISDALGGRSQETRLMTDRPRGEAGLVTCLVLVTVAQVVVTIWAVRDLLNVL